MKTLGIVLLLVCVSALFGQTLISESFSNTGFPDGWTRTGASQNVWSISDTNLAGGTARELKLFYSPTATSLYRFISPAFDTRKVHDMTLSFRHMLDDYEITNNSYTIGVQISTDLSNWTTVWSVYTTSSIDATTVNANITFSNGQSQTTYIAFFLNGNNDDIDAWYIDDVNLSYTNTLGSGTWSTGVHYPVGDVIVPSGHTFSLQAGTSIHFDTLKKLVVEGRVIASGDFGNPVSFQAISNGATWAGIQIANTASTQDSTLFRYCYITESSDSGIQIYGSNKIRISSSYFFNNSGILNGGGLLMGYTDAIIENCVFSENSVNGHGSALYCVSSSAKIRNSEFSYNEIFSGKSAVYLYGYGLNNFTGNTIIRNIGNSVSDCALWLASCSGVLERQMIANNDASGLMVENMPGTHILKHCNIVHNYGKGILNSGNLYLTGCIIWGNDLGGIYNTNANLQIRYCDLQGGYIGIEGTSISIYNYAQNKNSDPLFVSPTQTHNSTSNPLTANWTLQTGSPCIDGGDPALAPDADGSVVDIGMYSRKIKPFITRAADVYPDQGHQLDLQWQRSDLDVSFQPGAYYSVWRQGVASPRVQSFIADPALVMEELSQNPNSEICWREGDRVWYYLSQVPAVNFTDYGIIVPTLQDSSSTGIHSAIFMVMYQNASGWWQSISKSGYTVDNIPPATARNLYLQAIAPTQLRLAWDAVTEGYWEGNSYPELNQISYKVYAGDTPDFMVNSSSYLCTTPNPELIINPVASRKFYRIIASDTP